VGLRGWKGVTWLESDNDKNFDLIKAFSKKVFRIKNLSYEIGFYISIVYTGTA